MPLILAEGGLVFVSDEASVTTTVEEERPEVVTAAGSPTRQVAVGVTGEWALARSPAPGQLGGAASAQPAFE